MSEIRSSDKNKVYIIFVVGILLFGIGLRIYWVFNHFTHYDDVGLIIHLVELKKRQGSLMEYFGWAWTYAPLQVFLSGILVNPEYSYIINLVLGRLPSCVFGILSIVFTYHMIGKIFENSANCKYLKIFSVALIAFSWENIIYSAQAEPYEIGVLGIIFIILYLYRTYETKEISVRTLIVLSLFVIYSQYHSAVYLMALYISAFFGVDKKNKLRLFICGFISVCLCVPLIHSFLSRGMFARGTNWNVGVTGRFLFPETGNNNFSMFSSVDWFIRNAYIYIQNFFISNQTGSVVIILTIVFLLLCFIGFIEFHRPKKNIILIVFIDISTAIFIGLIVMRKFTFSPSRHTLLFYPIFLLLFCQGFDFILRLLKNKNIKIAMVFVWGILMASVYIYSSITEFPLRKNLILGGQVEEFLVRYKPDSIVSYSCYDLRLMSLPGYELVKGSDPLWISMYASKKTETSGYIMLVGTGRPLDQNTIDNSQSFLLDIPGNMFTERDWGEKNVVESYIIETNTEVEYAKGHFWNMPNGLYIYILSI